MIATKAVKKQLANDSKFYNEKIESQFTEPDKSQRIVDWKYSHLMTAQLSIVFNNIYIYMYKYIYIYIDC